MAGKKTRSNHGPQAQFRVHRMENGGLRLTDESKDPDGRIIARLWTTDSGLSRRGKTLVLQPGEAKKKVTVQLFVVDDHQASAVVTKELTVGAKGVEEKEVEPITPTPPPSEVDDDPEEPQDPAPEEPGDPEVPLPEPEDPGEDDATPPEDDDVTLPVEPEDPEDTMPVEPEEPPYEDYDPDRDDEDDRNEDEWDEQEK
jgi:hypothetical protein